MSSKVVNATDARKNFLKMISSRRTYLISRDYEAAAALVPVEIYEKLVRPLGAGLPALAVLGARPCGERKAREAIANVNEAQKYFSKTVFVCGPETEKYSKRFRCADLRVAVNQKPSAPLITSLKLAASALSGGDEYMVFCFLSKPPRPAALKKISAAVKAAASKKKGIVITKIKDRPSHPVAVSKKYFRTLLSTRKELGLPYIIRKFGSDVLYV